MKRIQDVFREITTSEPAPGLRSRVLARIEKEQKTLLAHRRQMSFAGLVFSTSLFSFGVFQYGGPLLQSDFWRFFSLIFSDLGLVTVSFQDFAYSLLETLPVVPLFALFAPLALFLWSVGFFLSLSENHETKSFSHSMLAH